MVLTDEENIRYSRHLMLPEVGATGQQRLKQARVLIVGAGGLGSPVALYLAAAGVGCLGIVDDDTVDHSNLHRQILYTDCEVHRLKTEVAAKRLRRMNSHVTVVPHAARLTADNAMALLTPYDLVIDGTDNFPTRYLLNDACVLLNKPYVYGSILRFEGRATLFDASRGPCYRCLYPELPPPNAVPSCAEGGVLGVLPGTIGMIQATEAIKWILGVGTSLVGRLLLFDALTMRFRELALVKDPHCPVCGTRPTITTLTDVTTLCDGPHETTIDPREISASELRAWLARGESISLIDVREPHEYAICRLPGAELLPLRELRQGIDRLDPARATVCYCHHGMRSMNAVEQFRAAGFTNVRSLHGGINTWAEEIDPTMPRY